MSTLKLVDKMFFPHGIKCIICDNELSVANRYGVCPKCAITYNDNYCQKCGRGMSSNVDYCADCIELKYDFDLARAPYVFDGDVKNAVYKLKYGNCRYLAAYFAQSMADVFYANKWTADYITFAPIAPKRRRFRGYNQAELIAQKLSELLNLPLIETLKRKDSKKKNLAKLNRVERRNAIKGTISCFDDLVLDGKSILFIDDVFTSGATSNECAAVLKNMGVSAVNILTFTTSKAHEILPNRFFNQCIKRAY